VLFSRGDGDGWTECALGHRHWGLHGAAGLLLWHGGSVLLQHRAEWSHQQAAAREATEESGLDPRSYTVTGRFVDDHGGWSYTTVIARTRAPALPRALTPETLEVRWVPVGELAQLPLHPGFAATWERVRSIAQASNAAGSTVTGNGSTSLSGCPGSARPTST
jgi:8-oxo-dGTP diphosphatase